MNAFTIIVVRIRTQKTMRTSTQRLGCFRNMNSGSKPIYPQYTHTFILPSLSPEFYEEFLKVSSESLRTRVSFLSEFEKLIESWGTRYCFSISGRLRQSFFGSFLYPEARSCDGGMRLMRD